MFFLLEQMTEVEFWKNQAFGYLLSSDGDLHALFDRCRFPSPLPKN